MKVDTLTNEQLRIKAIDLYKKLGFKQEGKISREYFIEGEFYANILMGLMVD